MRINLLVVCILIFTTRTFSQDFNLAQVQRIEALGLQIDKQNWSQEQVQADFNQMLLFDQSYRKRRNAATVLGIVSAGSLALGSGLIATRDRTQSDYRRGEDPGLYQGLLGLLVLNTAVAEGTVAIPMFIISKKRKRQRDAIIEAYSIEQELLDTDSKL